MMTPWSLLASWCLLFTEEKMNYSTDKPIDSCEQDLLGRSSFSKQLGKAIYDYKGKDGLVIGLYGKWGSGKRSWNSR